MTRLDWARWIDRYLGNLLCGFFGVLGAGGRKGNRTGRHQNVRLRRILVIRVWTIGESLLSLPMVERLSREYPQASLEVLATPRSQAVFRGHDFVDRVRLLSLRSLLRLFWDFRRYDLVVDAEPYFRFSALLTFWLGKQRIGFDHGVRSWVYTAHGHYLHEDHAVYSFCTLLKPLGIDYRPKSLVALPFSEQDRSTIREKIENFSQGRPVIAMHTSTSESVQERAWPMEHFVRLIDLCTSKEAPFVVILTGYSDHDATRNAAIIKKIHHPKRAQNWAKQVSFGQFCALLSEVNYFVANDSGPMHLAAAQGAKTIGLFGPETPERYAPFPPERNISFYKNPELGVGPCIQPWLGKTLDCTRQIEALRRITPEEVFNQLLND